MSKASTSTSTAVISPTSIPKSEDKLLKSINGKTMNNSEGIVNTAIFSTLVATGDEELVRALTANVLNALEEGFRQIKNCHSKQDLIGMATSVVKLIPRSKALGLRNVGKSLEDLVDFVDKATAPPPSAAAAATTSTSSSKAVEKKEVKLPGTPASRQKKFEADLEKAMELSKLAEKEMRKAEDFMLRYNGEAGLENLEE